MPSKVVEKVKREKQITTKPALPTEPVRETVKKEKAVVPQPEERVVVADIQKEAEVPQDEDDPMYDLFGSYVEEEEPEEQYVRCNTPSFLPKIFKQDREPTCTTERLPISITPNQ